MYASSMVQYLFAYGLILYRGGTTYAKPLQITETQLLSLSNDSSETNSYNPWSMANDSSLSLNVSNPDNSEIRCERYKYGFIDDEVLVDCGKALPYMVDSSEINFVEDREMQGNVVCLPYRIYGSEFTLFRIPEIEILRTVKKLAQLRRLGHVDRGTCYFEMGLMEGKTSAIAMMDQVRIAAISLSRQCGKRFQGGIATSLGQSRAARNISFISTRDLGRRTLGIVRLQPYFADTPSRRWKPHGDHGTLRTEAAMPGSHLGRELAVLCYHRVSHASRSPDSLIRTGF